MFTLRLRVRGPVEDAGVIPRVSDRYVHQIRFQAAVCPNDGPMSKLAPSKPAEMAPFKPALTVGHQGRSDAHLIVQRSRRPDCRFCGGYPQWIRDHNRIAKA